MGTIKEIYANLQADSPLYPGVAATTVSNWCVQMGLVDNRFRVADSDRHFTSAHTKDRALMAANMDEKTKKMKEKAMAQALGADGDSELITFQMINAMPRYEFIEFLLRVIK